MTHLLFSVSGSGRTAWTTCCVWPKRACNLFCLSQVPLPVGGNDAKGKINNFHTMPCNLSLSKVIEVKREWKTCLTGEGAYVLDKCSLHFASYCFCILCFPGFNRWAGGFMISTHKLFQHEFKTYTSHLLLLGKFEYGGGPIFKVVLEC